MKIIPKIFIVIITLIAGAIFITFLIDEIENITNKLIIIFSGAWLLAIIGVNLTNTLSEEKED